MYTCTCVCNLFLNTNTILNVARSTTILSNLFHPLCQITVATWFTSFTINVGLKGDKLHLLSALFVVRSLWWNKASSIWHIPLTSAALSLLNRFTCKQYGWSGHLPKLWSVTCACTVYLEIAATIVLKCNPNYSVHRDTNNACTDNKF